MRRIDRLPFGVAGCSLLPYVGNATEGEWFVDTGIEATSPKIFLSRAALVECAKEVGWVDPVDHAAVSAERDDLRRELQDVREQLEERDRAWDALDVIESQGFTARKRRGPKPKKSEEVVV
jgi:hypothetical protein